MENTLTTLFVLVDDFCKEFMPEWEKRMLESNIKKRKRMGNLSPSEIMTICIHFHQSHYRTSSIIIIAMFVSICSTYSQN